MRIRDRPQLKKLLRDATQGDVVIVAAVDRLLRDTTDLLVIARDLQKAGARSPSAASFHGISGNRALKAGDRRRVASEMISRQRVAA